MAGHGADDVPAVPASREAAAGGARGAPPPPGGYRAGRVRRSAPGSLHVVAEVVIALIK